MTDAMAHRIEPDRNTTTPPTRALLAGGAVAGPAFIIAFMAQAAFRPDYHPMRHSISSLAVGSPYGWIRSVNFIVAGLLTLAFAAGVRRALRPGPGGRWGAILIALWGVGLLGAGIFTTGPEAGYPPGTPVGVTETSAHAILHSWSAGLGFPALFVACLVFTRRFAARHERGWALYSAASATVFITFTVLHNYTTVHETGFGVGFSGLFQRIAVICGWGWLTALALHLLCQQSAGRPRH